MIDFEVWPGPMEGIGKGGFIDAVNSLKLVPQWMTPFYRLSLELPGRKKFEEFFNSFRLSGVPVCAQLMGIEPELLGTGGAIFAGLGAVEINLNFGCPSSRVVSGGAGGGALKHPAGLDDFCRRVKAKLPPDIPLSVKLRSGWSDPAEMEYILPCLVNSGAVSKIFFHYRTVKELYYPVDKAERLRRFQRAVELAAPLPLILNGDISSVDEAVSLVQSTNAAGVMIARAWLQDPWLLRRFYDAAPPDAETGRERFFEEAASRNIHRGGMIELAKMMWGTAHPRFRELIRDCSV